MATCGETVGAILFGHPAVFPTCGHPAVFPTSDAHTSAAPDTRFPAHVQMVYTTACCSNIATGDGSFVPLTVNYSERFSAAGRTA